MISPARQLREAHHDRQSATADRWLVGLLAGAALAYLLGRALGLGRSRRTGATNPPDADR